MQIFPEGARTNGTHIIRFNKGAFTNGCRFNLILFKYHRTRTPFYNGIYPLLTLFSSFEIINAGIYDPKYLGITDYSKDWEIVANDVK